MPLEVIVFDFDGTLVDTNGLKEEAYFQIFEDFKAPRELISSIIRNIKEESRYAIIEEICQGLKVTQERDSYFKKYNEIVEEGAIKAKELNNAVQLLEKLSANKSLYLSSNTPKIFLDNIIEKRGWRHFFKEIYGYPSKKPETLKSIQKLESSSAKQMAVIGDGESDKNSAESIGCSFYNPNTLSSSELLKVIQ
jgi:phosphoglycolate phosphatase